MSEYPSYRACARYLEFIYAKQSAQCDRPVPLTPAEIARATGITEADQIQIRQQLMLAGRLRLSALDGPTNRPRWAYQVVDHADAMER